MNALQTEHQLAWTPQLIERAEGMSSERREQLPRWATAVATWVIVVLLGIIGTMVAKEREAILNTQRALVDLVHNHDVRLSVLEAQRQTAKGAN